MAFIRKRGNKYSVVYKVKDENNVDRQKSETFATKKEADRRKKEIEYKMALGNFKAPKCILLKELLEEYIKIYGHDRWSVSSTIGRKDMLIREICGNIWIN